MIKIGIVCGCLPAQAGIDARELYHRILMDNIFSHREIQAVIASVWYTTVAESKAKIQELLISENPGIILYHVRPDPFLRISKLVIRYRDSSDSFRFFWNTAADDSSICERSYPERGSLPVRNKRILRMLFSNFNYLLGMVTGVHNRAIACEQRMLQDISAQCMREQRPLIIVGPASRPRSVLENYLLKRLEIKLAKKFKNKNYFYVSCFGTNGINNERLFMEDGVHVNRAGHRRLAELITPVLKETLRKQGGNR